MSIPIRPSLNIFWNFGFLLGCAIVIQTTTGFLLTITYRPSSSLAFDLTSSIKNEKYFGWLLYNTHRSNVTLIFIILYTHIFRGIHYKLFKNLKIWSTGILLLILTIIVSFLGYVLPWNQISFWAAKVITNLLTTIPLFGNTLTHLVWGDYSVRGCTLHRFYSLHTALPLLIWAAMLLHLYFLHTKGSNNPLGTKSLKYTAPFNPYYTTKDTFTLILLITTLAVMISLEPYLFLDYDNFNKADNLNTPTHIKPDWFLLWAYAILRRIESKTGGVICLLLTFIVLTQLKIINKNHKLTQPLKTTTGLITLITLLRFSGSLPIEAPYTSFSKIITTLTILILSLI